MAKRMRNEEEEVTAEWRSPLEKDFKEVDPVLDAYITAVVRASLDPVQGSRTPIALEVFNREERESHKLAYWPSDEATGRNLLLTLYYMHGEFAVQQVKLIEAVVTLHYRGQCEVINNSDDDNDEDTKREKAEKLVTKYCGKTSLGTMKYLCEQYFFKGRTERIDRVANTVYMTRLNPLCVVPTYQRTAGESDESEGEGDCDDD